MGNWFPELPENRERIRDVLRAEEERFTETLARGMKLFEEVASRGAISGKEAFDLTATYGFPFELTRELALERGIPVDEDDFQQRMAEHREVSRAGGGRVVTALPGPPSEFVGYDQTEVLTAIIGLNDLGDGRFEAKLERSPFYPAGGGQVSDTGWIEHDETGARAQLRRRDPGRRRPGARLRGNRLRRRRPGEGRGSRGQCASRRWRTTRRPISCTSRCGGCWASTSRRRARPSGPTSSVSTSRTRRR